VVLIDPRPSPAAQQLAEHLGAPMNESWEGCVADVDQVWLCVAGNLVVDICSALIGEIPNGTTVVDLTTAAADDKRLCATKLAAHGIQYVDLVIMGSVSTAGARTALLGAGDTMDDIAPYFSAFGAPVSVMAGGKPGDAAAVKLLRTILTKGLESLAVECFMAAETQGLRGALYDQLADFDETGIVKFLEMLVTSHVQHASRRLHEVQRAQDQLRKIGVPSVVLGGSESRFEITVAALQNTPPTHNAGDVEGAVKWLLQSSDSASSR
jgi:3-hydroxyisobutyrate dehydrogenase-like beta-hydroxyacid dehydrogenase